MKRAIEPLSVENDLSFHVFVFGSLFLGIKIFFFHSLSHTHSIISYVFGIIILTSYQSNDNPEKDEKASEHKYHLHNIGRLDGVRNVERQIDQGS